MDDPNSKERYAKIELYTDFLYPGMLLKGDLYTESGEKVNLAKDPITKELVNDLKGKGIKKVFYNKPTITTAKTGMIPLDMLDKAYSVSQEITSSVVNKGPLPKKEIEQTVEQFMEKVTDAEVGTILNLIELKDYDEYTYTHSINVAMISILFAKQLSWPEKTIRSVGIGAMLHDMGKILVPSEIVNKNGKLTDSEFAIMKKHTIYGYEVVKSQSDYSDEILKIPLLHHECYDGTGYPFGLSGEKINDMAYLVSLSDYFDAVTSARSYKVGFPSWHAFLLIQKNVGTKFHPRLAVDFINKMPQHLMGKALLTIGNYVVLNTGEIGEVVSLPKVESLKPVIKLYLNGNRPLKYPIEINLEFDNSRTIENVVENKELLDMLEHIRRSFLK